MGVTRKFSREGHDFHPLFFAFLHKKLKNDNFGVYYRGTAYDVIIFKFQEGGIRPLPFPADAHALYAGAHVKVEY